MTNKLNAQSLGFQPLRTGDRKGQSGDICSRSNQQKASVTFEVVRELGFGLIVDCQVFFKGASKNVRTSDSPVVPERSLVKRDAVAHLLKRKDFFFRFVCELENRVFIRKISGHCDGANRLEPLNPESPHSLCAFRGGFLDGFKLGGFDCFAKEVQNLSKYFFQVIECGHSFFLRDNEHCFVQKPNNKGFHGLLLSLRDFDLRPLFSHALGKAIPSVSRQPRMDNLNHTSLPRQCSGDKESTLRSDLEFNERVAFGINKKQFFLWKAVPVEMDRFDVRIRSFLVRAVNALFAAKVPEKRVTVFFVRKVERAIAADVFKSNVRGSGLKREVNGINLFFSVKNRFFHPAGQRRSPVATGKFDKRHCFVQKPNDKGFHSLLLSLSEFCLRPLFSHALEKALPPFSVLSGRLS
nr:MAG TPA: hypothetical protein [Caudoviricetes sp.]